MKKLSIALLVSMISSVLFSQNDVITKHNGEEIQGKVIRLNEYTIEFSYVNEDAVNTIGKYAVEKIVYGKSGRVEHVTDRIVVEGENDWEKVVILEDKSYTAGLKKGDEIRGKSAFINFHTGNTADKKAEKKIKMQAAKMKCPFILLTADKDINQTGFSGPSFGNVQSIKKGIAYRY